MSDNTKNPLEEIVSEEEQIDAIFATNNDDTDQVDNEDVVDNEDEQTEDTLEEDEDNTPSEEAQDEEASDEDDVEEEDAEDDDDDESDDDLDPEKEEVDDNDESWTIEELSEEVKSITLPDGSKTTVKDLVDNRMMQSDYTKKTQAIATERKEVEAQRDSLSEKSEMMKTENEQIALAWQEEFKDAEENFRLDPSNPEAKQRYDEANVNFKAAVRQFEESQAVNQSLMQEKYSTQVQTANDYAVEHIDGWNQKYAKDLVQYMVEASGATQEDIMKDISGPVLEAFDKARKFDTGEKVASSKRSIAKKKGKSLSKTASKSKKVSKISKKAKSDEEAIKNYEQSGDVEDLLSLF